MTEFKLTNGQAIELTKDGILFKGNRIEIDGKVVIDKDDRHIAVLEQDGNKMKQSSVDIDEPKRAPIKNNIEAVVSLDTSKMKRQFKLLEEAAESLKEKYEAKQPHVRIEFDDVLDVPKVWVDGELMGDVDYKPLVSLKVDWNTNTEKEEHKAFEIEYLDLDNHQRKSFSEGSFM